MKIDFDDLVGEKGNYYGTKGTCFKLGDAVFEVFEDDCDEYRSTMSHVEETEREDLADFSLDSFEVTIHSIDTGSYVGYELKNKVGFSVLRFGTDNADDYYPSFVFESSNFDYTDYVADLKRRIKQ